MGHDREIPGILETILKFAASAKSLPLSAVTANPLIRKTVTRQVEKSLLNALEQSRSDPEILPGVQDDRVAIGLAVVSSIERALAGKHLSENTIRGILQLLVKGLFFEQGDQSKARVFEEKYKERAPSFLLISPGKACNLRCSGCYADSADEPRTLEWHIVDRMIEEARDLWGARFVVISGGEPFAYRSEGKNLLDLIEKHPDTFFMTYTNGTLITNEISRRLADDGNMILCISVEGWKQRTDERRGEGTFEKILETMSRLRNDGVPFGISLTGTRYNAEEILSDDFLDYFIQQGVMFGWLFQYMPIGRAYTLDLMVTPEQRTWMWRRSWQIVREKRFFLADFWNSGTACDGCLSAGGHGNGGYFYIDWNGAVSPCVFMPYSPVNIHDVYASGGNLNDVWNVPFFQSLRQWQHNYHDQRRNGLAPCPNRDHHDELEQLLRAYEPEPADVNAAETLTDPGYTRGLVAYNRKYESLTGDIWRTHYVEGKNSKGGIISALPDLPESILEPEDQQVHKDLLV